MALQNGALDATLLVSAAGSAGARLRFGTAMRWAAIRYEVHALYGWWPEVTSAGDGYRSLARQIDLFKRNYVPWATGHGPAKVWNGQTWWRRTAGTPSAATPGTSNHGLGTTVDVVGLGGLNNFSTTRYKQFAAVAARHGFSNREGRSIGEPWHWSDTQNPDIATSATPPATGLPKPPSTPAVPEEDIVASRAELQQDIANALRPVLDTLARVQAGLDVVQAATARRRTWVKFAGSNLAWIDLGVARRRGTAELYGADGRPPIGILSLRDPFWRLPIIGDAWGETYRRTGQEAAWLLELDDDGRLVRRWPGREAFFANGAPPIVDLPPEHDFWSLPAVGGLPPEGA